MVVPAAAAADRWVRAGVNVAYYPSPYRGRPSAAAVAGAGTGAGRGKEGPGEKGEKGAEAAAGGSGSSGKKGGVGVRKGGVRKGGAKTGSAAAAGSGHGSTSSLASSGNHCKESAAKEHKDAAAGSVLLSPIGPGLYCCTFTLMFEVPGVYYISSCYPYSYTDLQEHLYGLCARLNAQQPLSRSPSPSPHSSPQPRQGFLSGVDGSSSTTGSTAYNSGSTAAVQQSSGTCGTIDLSAAGNGSGCGQYGQTNGPPAGGVLARSPLCASLRGAGLECVTVTDFGAPPEVVRQRETVVLTARVHPGETCASWIMQVWGLFLAICAVSRGGTHCHISSLRLAMYASPFRSSSFHFKPPLFFELQTLQGILTSSSSLCVLKIQTSNVSDFKCFVVETSLCRVSWSS